MEIVTVSAVEGAAYGATLLAAVGAGQFEDVESACEYAVRITGAVVPDNRNSEMYSRLHAVYRDVYPDLRPTFEPHGTA